MLSSTPEIALKAKEEYIAFFKHHGVDEARLDKMRNTAPVPVTKCFSSKSPGCATHRSTTAVWRGGEKGEVQGRGSFGFRYFPLV